MKLCNLNYLKSISPENPKFVVEMIQLFLKNVPLSIETMKSSLIASEWNSMEHHAHKVKSHFDCMGIKKEYRDAAKQIEDYSKQKENLELIPPLIVKIEHLFQQASIELIKDLNTNYNTAFKQDLNNDIF